MYGHSVASNTFTVSLYCYKGNNCRPFRQTGRYSYGMNYSLCVCMWYVCVSGFHFYSFRFLYFDFFLLSPCTTEQWLTCHWWYAYHSLINPASEYLNSHLIFLYDKGSETFTACASLKMFHQLHAPPSSTRINYKQI
jgi:hypothetical protein